MMTPTIEQGAQQQKARDDAAIKSLPDRYAATTVAATIDKSTRLWLGGLPRL